MTHFPFSIFHFPFVKAGALFYVLVLMLVVGIMSSALISKAYLNSIELQSCFDSDRAHRNALSGIQLLMGDEELGRSGEALWLDLYDTGADSVLLQRKSWGAFEVAVCKAFVRNNEVTKLAAIGLSPAESDRTALLVLDNDRAISVCGTTRLVGNCYLPKYGTKPAYIEGKSFMGRRPVEGLTLPAPNVLPPADKALMHRVSELMKPGANDSVLSYAEAPDSLWHSFAEKTLCLEAQGNLVLNNQVLSGNIRIVSNGKIRIKNTCELNNVVICAPKVVIDSGFAGSIQAFASDSLVVGKNCKLGYPSVLGVVRMEDSPLYPVLKLGEGSEVSGSIFALEEKTTYNRQVKLCLDKKTLVQGEVYSSGQADVKGAIEGRLTCAQIVLVTPSSVYDNHLLDAVIDRTKLSKYYAGVNVMSENRNNTIVKWMK